MLQRIASASAKASRISCPEIVRDSPRQVEFIETDFIIRRLSIPQERDSKQQKGKAKPIIPTGLSRDKLAQVSMDVIVRERAFGDRLGQNRIGARHAGADYEGSQLW